VYILLSLGSYRPTSRLRSEHCDLALQKSLTNIVQIKYSNSNLKNNFQGKQKNIENERKESRTF
jgi:hypothetical protein